MFDGGVVIGGVVFGGRSRGVLVHVRVIQSESAESELTKVEAVRIQPALAGEASFIVVPLRATRKRVVFAYPTPILPCNRGVQRRCGLGAALTNESAPVSLLNSTLSDWIFGVAPQWAEFFNVNESWLPGGTAKRR